MERRAVRAQAVKFFITFFLTIAVALVFAYQINEPFREAEAELTVRLARFMGAEAYRLPPYKILSYYPEGMLVLDVTLSCSALFTIAVFLFLVLLTPGISLRMRLIAGVLTCPILYFMNILRMVFVLYAGKALGESAIRLFHDWMGGAIMFFAALLAYSFWLYLALSRPSEIKIRTLDVQQKPARPEGLGVLDSDCQAAVGRRPLRVVQQT